MLYHTHASSSWPLAAAAAAAAPGFTHETPGNAPAQSRANGRADGTVRCAGANMLAGARDTTAAAPASFRGERRDQQQRAVASSPGRRGSRGRFTRRVGSLHWHAPPKPSPPPNRPCPEGRPGPGASTTGRSTHLCVRMVRFVVTWAVAGVAGRSAAIRLAPPRPRDRDANPPTRLGGRDDCALTRRRLSRPPPPLIPFDHQAPTGPRASGTEPRRTLQKLAHPRPAPWCNRLRLPPCPGPTRIPSLPLPITSTGARCQGKTGRRRW